MKKVFPSTIVEPAHGSDHFKKPERDFPVKFTICILSFLLLLSPALLSAQASKQQWVDSVFQRLTTAEKIGQLFMIPVSSNATNEEISLLSAKLKKYKPGSLLITHGSPIRHVRLMKKLQSQANVPLMTAIRAEQGIASCLDSTIRFSPFLQLGAVRNENQIFELGAEMGQQMKWLGLHMNLSLNADIHIANDMYPGTLRYMSDNKHQATGKLIALMTGLQRSGVLVSASHLGNPKKDRHLAIQDSSVVLDVNNLDTVGFYPFQKLLQSGVDGIVTSNLDFVLSGKKKALLASVSDLFVADVIQKKLGYEGLTMVEMPYFRKASRKKRPGLAERLAFEVGHDVLIDPMDLSRSIKQIATATKKDKRLQLQLDQSVKKILAAKYDAGLHKLPIPEEDNLLLKLYSPKARTLQRELSAASITLLKNKKSLIPISLLENATFASVSFGKNENNEFNHYLSKYAEFTKHAVLSLKDTLGLGRKVNGSSIIVVSLYPPAKGITLQLASIIQRLSLNHEVIVCSFGDPEDLKFIQSEGTLIAGYTDDNQTQQAAAEVIFGGLPAKGQLPITVSEELKINNGILTDTLDRLSFALPEEVGMDSRALEKIKNIMKEAIEAGATPGCQVLVARHGKIVYEESAGWFTYDKKEPVNDQTIYDLASVTKISATLQTVMFMHEKRLIDINKKISVYLPELRESNKKDFTIKDILTHQAGLWPFLPFWAGTVKNSPTQGTYYQTELSDEYPFPVADSLFAHKSMKDSLWQWIVNAKVRDKITRTVYDYRYSDMGFYMLQHLAEKILNQPMHEFLEQNFYAPLGAYTMGYLPRQEFPASRIAPTENDQLFRKRLLVGYVHDQGAAMHGGIAGHAGLFGTANDMAKLGQMWLQKGRYGGQQFFKPETLDLFTAKQYADSRRGLGWDKPVASDPAGPTSIYASSKTFGHTGFTGTCIWVDPEFDLVYVFLSNRVYPDMNNNKILNANIRPRIQDLIYQSMFSYSATQR
ncbi:MAG: serine hydrolase [Cyclobacteriaceae bacterium]|nr:serine hydrolase [Cyclobacteriaceae bacterium]